jgi:hypothetical protein
MHMTGWRWPAAANLPPAGHAAAPRPRGSRRHAPGLFGRATTPARPGGPAACTSWREHRRGRLFLITGLRRLLGYTGLCFEGTMPFLNISRLSL